MQLSYLCSHIFLRFLVCSRYSVGCRLELGSSIPRLLWYTLAPFAAPLFQYLQHWCTLFVSLSPSSTSLLTVAYPSSKHPNLFWKLCRWIYGTFLIFCIKLNAFSLNIWFAPSSFLSPFLDSLLTASLIDSVALCFQFFSDSAYIRLHFCL